MKRRGTIMFAVLVMTALTAMLAAGLMFRMRAEVASAAAGKRGSQAHAAAMSGIERAIMILRSSRDAVETWWDNPDAFENQFVCDDGSSEWYFTIYARGESDLEQFVRYGLTDEAGRININFAPRETLEALPGMTSELVDCLMDYRDSDSEPLTEGAEQEDYYDRLALPYLIKNGPLATVEELLLVKGFNGEVVYGEDANMNCLLDANEDDGEESFPLDDGDGQLNAGLVSVGTVLSYEPNADREGNAKVNINGGESEVAKLQAAGLPAETVEFIQEYRASGKTFSHPSELLNMRAEIRRQVSAAGGAGGRGGRGSNRGRRGRSGRGESSSSGTREVTVTIESGVDSSNLALVMDKLTVLSGGAGVQVRGLVNVNTAPTTVLAALPGIDENLASRIVETRRELDSETKSSVAWLYTEGVVEEDVFKAVAPLLTAQSYQFHVRCVGFGVPCGRYRIIEAVIDLAGGEPRVVYFRELTRLGLPFALEGEDAGLQEIR